MNDTQEVRTVWSWDTTNVELASKRIEQHFGRVDAAEKKSVQTSASNKKAQTASGGGHGGGGSNIGMGIHDTLMGRGTAGLFRFGNAAKLGAAYASGVAIAVELGGKAFHYAAGEMEKTDRAAERLAESFVKVSKAATFSTVGAGSSKLTGTREGLIEQIEGEKKQQSDLRDQQLLENQQFMGDPRGGGRFTSSLSAGGGVYKAYDYMKSYLTGSQTTDEKMADSQLRERAAGQQLGQLNRKITGAYGSDRDIADERSFRGNPFEAQRLESRRKEEAEIAELRKNGVSQAENVPLIRQRYAIEKEGIDRAEAAAKRQLDLEWNITRAKREGGASDVRSAKERMDAAGKALALEVPGTLSFREKQNAFSASRDDYAATRRGRRIERAGHRFDMQAAGFRGNDDARAALTAQAEVDKAQATLRILQETKGVKASTQEIDEASLALAKAQTAQVLLQRQQEMARLKLVSDIQRAPQSVRAAGALLGGASSEQAERAGLVDQVQAAQAALALATQRVEIEKGSREAIEGQVAASEALAKAQIGVAQYEQQVRRERRYEQQGTQGETAALRFSASGRDDLGERASQRNQSMIAIEHANQADPEGKYGIARELAEQQRLREQKTVQSMYLNGDGTRRNPAAVQREINERKLKQKRFEAFNSEHPLGLSNIHRGSHGEMESGVDMLTGQRLNARQIAERNATAKAQIDTPQEKQSDSATFASILDVLNKRLPATTK